MINKIIVNASSLRSGGALTILRQFISEVPEDDFEYLVFVDESVSFPDLNQNMSIVQVNTRSFFNRFIWDALGLNRWIKLNHIHPLAAISLQNTNFRLSACCPNFVYYHQSIPFYKNKWHFFKQDERIFWFYKYIYPFFIALFLNQRTEIFVQLEFIRQGFINRFNFDENKIHVVFPKLETPSIAQNGQVDVDENAVNLFYPAVALVYKNHQVLFNALSLINGQINKKIVIYLTNTKDEFELEQNYDNVDIVFLGKIAPEEVIWLYHQVDALVFPSYIETLGLPLIEAASFGLPVIASDLPYSREVLNGYEGVTYVDYQDAISWGKEIINLSLIKGKRFEYFRKENTKSWKYFFEIINKSL